MVRYMGVNLDKPEEVKEPIEIPYNLILIGGLVLAVLVGVYFLSSGSAASKARAHQRKAEAESRRRAEAAERLRQQQAQQPVSVKSGQ